MPGLTRHPGRRFIRRRAPSPPPSPRGRGRKTVHQACHTPYPFSRNAIPNSTSISTAA
ncbi:MAG: hypothetical protein JWP60_1977 [Ramlibacter sp.]|nr:hypothetical protein [Ramlibacter sp.]